MLLPNGTISPLVQDGALVKSDIDGNDETDTWNIESNVGAAKYHQLWTQGTCAGPDDHSVEFDNDTELSPQFSSLTYNYFCQNGSNQLPENCACEKEIIFDYGYDSEAMASSMTRRNCIHSKNAVSAAEDNVLVGYTIGTQELVMVDAMSVRAESQCERSVNPEFWQNASDVLFELAEIGIPFLAGDSAAATALLMGLDLDDLAMDVNTLIGTPFYDVRVCDQATRTGTIQGGETLALEPNVPVTFFIFSATNMLAGGRRSWFSTGRVLSNFNLTAYVPADSFGEDHCCTEKETRWLWATYPGAPNPGPNGNVGTFLGAYKPWNLPCDLNGALLVNAQFGKDVFDIDACPEIEGPMLDGEPDNIDFRNSFDLPNSIQMSLYDISGRLIFQGNESFVNNSSLEDYLSSKVGSSGIYFLELNINGEQKIQKLFLNKQ